MLADPPLDYEPLCSTRWGSCATVFTSEYSHILSHWGIVESNSMYDISLPVAGILNYSLFLMYPFAGGAIPKREAVLFTISSASIIFSCYLLYILKFVLQDFCIVFNISRHQRDICFCGSARFTFDLVFADSMKSKIVRILIRQITARVSHL